ncbi:MAG: ABC transporter permease [Oligoflexia bacterium]|nr:ABC transporter permease [Oligoflexia bacterium]
MKLSFFKYLTQFLFRAKTRQGLLLLSTLGLVISSFALIVLQSTMGGLQGKLLERSKNIKGHGTISINQLDLNLREQLKKQLIEKEILFVEEYQLEVLLKVGEYMAPVIVHGIPLDSKLPAQVFENNLEEVIIGRDLSRSLGLSKGDSLKLISPGHTTGFFYEVPRSISLYLDTVIGTDVPDVDSFHIWAPINKVRNLTGIVNGANYLRVFSPLKELKSVELPKQASITSWEEEHKTLVKALGLENTVMVFLFSATTILVGLSITTGLLILFDQTKVDLASFWILGSSEKSIFKSFQSFLYAMNFVSVGIGIGVGLIFLFLLDNYGLEIMPDIFVEQKIPVKITARGIGISFGVPLIIGLIFSKLSLVQFAKDAGYTKILRGPSL